MRVRSILLSALLFGTVGTAMAQTSGLSLSVTDGKTTIAPGDSMIYVVTAMQTTQPSQDVNLTLTLPVGVDLITPDNGGTVNGQTVTWTKAALTQNTSRIFTVQAHVPNTVAGGSTLTATAAVDSVQATDTTTVQSGAAATKSYALTLTDNSSVVRAGTTLHYVLTVKNNSTTAQTDTVTVQGPPSLTVQSANPLSTSLGTNSVTWSNVAFASGETKTFNFTAQVDAQARTNTSIETRATVGNATIADFTAVNNNASSSSSSSRSSSRSSIRSTSSRSSSSVRATAGNPLFRVSANTQEAAPGGDITYTLFAQNVLLNNIRDAAVSVRFDPALASVVSSPNGTTVNNGEVRWLLPTLAPGQTWNATLTLKVDPSLGNGNIVTAIGRMSGSDVNGAVLNERVVTVTTSVVTNLPHTGAAFDVLFLALSGVLALFFGIIQKGVQKP